MDLDYIRTADGCDWLDPLHSPSLYPWGWFTLALVIFNKEIILIFLGIILIFVQKNFCGAPIELFFLHISFSTFWRKAKWPLFPIRLNIRLRHVRLFPNHDGEMQYLTQLKTLILNTLTKSNVPPSAVYALARELF